MEKSFALPEPLLLRVLSTEPISFSPSPIPITATHFCFPGPTRLHVLLSFKLWLMQPKFPLWSSLSLLASTPLGVFQAHGAWKSSQSMHRYIARSLSQHLLPTQVMQY